MASFLPPPTPGRPRPEDLRHDAAFFGRSEELTELVRNLQRGRHTLITGEKGMGKTRLMLEARWVMSGRSRRIELSPNVMTRVHGQLGVRIAPDQYKILFIERMSPPGDCFREMAEKLYYNGDLSIGTDEERSDWQIVRKKLTALGSGGLQSAIFEGVSRSRTPYLIFLDTLDRASSLQQTFIEALLNISVVCAAVVQMKESFLFRSIWASFSRIELEPLPEPVAVELIDYFFGQYPLRVSDPGLYRREILQSSNGNPFHMKNILWHGSREKYIGSGEIRKLRRAEEGQYFNMGPIYILGVAMFTMFKIFSIGTDNREFYIYFSALGFIAYLLFRVFRAFFIFRPQKYR